MIFNKSESGEAAGEWDEEVPVKNTGTLHLNGGFAGCKSSVTPIPHGCGTGEAVMPLFEERGGSW